ncbi:MAG: glycosyltransferase family 39 protein [Candidatus Binatia bacterium]
MLAALAVAGALYYFQVLMRPAEGWLWLLVGLILAVLGQLGQQYPTPPLAPPPRPPSPARRALGAALALAGAVLWGLATSWILANWAAGFDAAWIGWVAASVLLAIGLDLAWGVWPRPAERLWRRGPLLVALGLTVVAGVYRLGNIATFPGEAAITQIEDLQVGNFGLFYLNGARIRWEYLSSTWLAALGIWLGGPSQFAMRVPFALISTVKLLPIFAWLRLSVGTIGAAVGTALLAVSFWDVVLSRIPNNHNTLIISISFALLAGAARRGRPSAYVVLGLFGGYILHEYVAYRPLAAIVLVGGALASLGDRTAGWPARLARPLITAVLLGTMVAPLFITRLPGMLRSEYFDGWNRAKGNTQYYDPGAGWQQAFERRRKRATDAAELFTVAGDRSPVRNIPNQPPIIDPVTCALLILGIGAAAAHALRPVFALTLIGFVVHVAGTLVMTGNFDVARVGGAVAYVYVLAGFGAAGLAQALRDAWGRIGRVVGIVLLAGAVAAAAWVNTRDLNILWNSPQIRRSHRNNLAYLSVWLGQHVRPGERVLGIAPAHANVLQGHDGSWLRGGDIDGLVTWDIESALRAWAARPGPLLFFLYDGRSTDALTAYLKFLMPELQFETTVDPLEMGADVTFARVDDVPPSLARVLANWRCRGVRAKYEIIGADGEEVLWSIDGVGPFVSRSVWPAELSEALYRLPVPKSGIRGRFTGDIAIATGGDYLFQVNVYAGSAELWIDGLRRADDGRTKLPLAAGVHHIEVKALFAPMAIEPAISLMWSGPESGHQIEVLPFYRLAVPDPSCVDHAPR